MPLGVYVFSSFPGVYYSVGEHVAEIDLMDLGY